MVLSKHSRKLKIAPGALDWLKWFIQNGFPQAIASSAPMENITLSLDEFQLSNTLMP
jgi:phosphoglycolate phosphatase-like HAD superfamily hydrolase